MVRELRFLLPYSISKGKKKKKATSKHYCCYHFALNPCSLLKFFNDVITSSTGPLSLWHGFEKVTFYISPKYRKMIPRALPRGSNIYFFSHESTEYLQKKIILYKEPLISVTLLTYMKISWMFNCQSAVYAVFIAISG